ncbi:hypothetical protein GCM10008956_21300 [Deinococcus arenae]|uniref:Uncharacterized protein n=1 Tax=Deinococcus arenae TaxID=1452751 RepID=A0A8H9GQX7_9DEIO|nr:hypothetical protein [Deinococcus arenae]AWT35169.1 hypothetical protein DM785_06080 [Deinococcus actinosclerus]GGM44757.1 hypothetical protein GCM10008956_21300 [Deinococcus arenae]
MTAPDSAPAPQPTPPVTPAAAPARTRRARRGRRPDAPPPRITPGRALAHLLGGLITLAVLAYFQWTPGEWPVRLLTWVALTIIADEFDGWYGYAALVLGGLGYFSPVTPPEQWSVILPLVGGALAGVLLIKHSGGLFVLPFAAALYAGVIIGMGRFATTLDGSLTLPTNEEFQRTALIAMIIGLTVSAVRRVVSLILRARARRAERATALNV